MPTLTSCLRYLDPLQVAVEGLRCNDMRVAASNGRTLGSLSGFIIDPVARQLKYFVVCGRGWWGKRTSLIPAESAQIDLSDRLIRLNADEDELRRRRIATDRRLPAFSDEDLLTMLFGRSSGLASAAAGL